jgi:DNA-binding LacI/PurR family transcriptional regulator
MITMQDVAEKAGVRKATVSYVLNGKHKKARISDKTCERIKSIALELGYRRNELARSVAIGKSKVIAFVSNRAKTCEYIGEIMAGILDETTRQSYSLKIYHLQDDNSSNIAEQIISNRVDGVIFYSNNSQLQIIHKEMEKFNIPCAAVNLSSETTCIGVTTDDCQGVMDSVKHLAELGHHRILYLSHSTFTQSEYIIQREAGYRMGMHKYIGKSAPLRIERLPQNYAENKIMIEKILREPLAERPSAIICINDMDAMDLLRLAYQEGIKIPQDLSIIGFADLEMAKYAIVPLTTISQPFEAMGQNTAKMLLEVIENRPNEDFTIKNLKLKTELIVRQSTAVAP